MQVLQMQLLGDKIVIESRKEIDQTQEMIDCFLKSGKADDHMKNDLKVIKEKLDGLYMCW
jgi:hypothetical protein